MDAVQTVDLGTSSVSRNAEKRRDMQVETHFPGTME